MTSSGRQGAGGHLPGFARGCIQNRWAILLSSISLVVIATLIASSDIANYGNPVITTGSDSAIALEAFEANFDDLAGRRAQIVLRTNDPIGPDTRDALTPMFDAISEVEGVATVLPPWEDPSGAHFSTNNSVAYGEVIFEESPSQLSSSTITNIEQIVNEFGTSSLQIEVGGSAVDQAALSDLDGNERFGLLAALVVLLMVFASLGAAASAILVSRPHADVVAGPATALMALQFNLLTEPQPVCNLLECGDELEGEDSLQALFAMLQAGALVLT